MRLSLDFLPSNLQLQLDKWVKAALEPYKALSGRINELENHFNVQSK